MKVFNTDLADLKIIEPDFFGDERGFFFESYNQKKLQEAGITEEFVQDNHSKSSKNVLRGLHYQLNQPQGKLVRVVSGEVYDLVVDLRKSSKTFKRWFGIHLSSENHKMLYVPPGFAHGFLVLSESADFLYKTTTFYAPQEERCLLWDDTELQINWPLEGIRPTLSSKDLKGATLQQALEKGDIYS